jgi:hypothetical protein
VGIVISSFLEQRNRITIKICKDPRQGQRICPVFFMHISNHNHLLLELSQSEEWEVYSLTE